MSPSSCHHRPAVIHHGWLERAAHCQSMTNRVSSWPFPRRNQSRMLSLFITGRAPRQLRACKSPQIGASRPAVAPITSAARRCLTACCWPVIRWRTEATDGFTVTSRRGSVESFRAACERQSSNPMSRIAIYRYSWVMMWGPYKLIEFGQLSRYYLLASEILHS